MTTTFEITKYVTNNGILEDDGALDTELGEWLWSFTQDDYPDFTYKFHRMAPFEDVTNAEGTKYFLSFDYETTPISRWFIEIDSDELAMLFKLTWA